MKLSFALLLSLTVLSFHGYTQSRGYIGLSIGPSLPVGEFAKTGTNDEKSGFAKLGAMAELSYTYPLKDSHYGLIASLRARWNPFNKEALLNPFRATYPGFEWQSNTPSWQSAAILIGAYRSFPLSDRLSFQTQLLVGVTDALLPATRITGVGNSTTVPGAQDAVFATSNKKYATAFSGALQAGTTYRFSNRFCFFSYLDFWYARPTFKNLTETVQMAQGLVIPGNLSPSNAIIVEQNTTTRDYTQPMNSLSLTFGLGMRL